MLLCQHFFLWDVCLFWMQQHRNTAHFYFIKAFNCKRNYKNMTVIWLDSASLHMRSGARWRSPGLLCSAVPHSVDMFEKVTLDLLKYYHDKTKLLTGDCSSLHRLIEDWAHNEALKTCSYLCTLSAPMFDGENCISLKGQWVEPQRQYSSVRQMCHYIKMALKKQMDLVPFSSFERKGCHAFWHRSNPIFVQFKAAERWREAMLSRTKCKAH